MRKAVGTQASPTAELLGGNIGSLRWSAYSGSTFRAGAQITAVATENHGDVLGINGTGMRITFATAKNTTLAAIERMTIQHDGKVGITTSTPGSTFDVKGSLAAQYISTTALAYNMLDNDFYLTWNGAAAGTVTLPAALAVGSGNYKGRIYQIKNTTTAQTLTVAANGTELVDDQGAAGVASLSLAPGEAVDIISTGATSGVTWDVVSHHATLSPAAIEPWYNVATNAGATSNTQNIYQKGVVGIGTATPTNQLNVAATGNTAAFDRYNASSITMSTLFIRKSAAATVGIQTALNDLDGIGRILFQGSNGTGFGIASNTGSEIRSYAIGNQTATNSGSDLRFWTNTQNAIIGSEKMRITDAGNVGVATTTPTSTLQVNGSVAAKIRSFSGSILDNDYTVLATAAVTLPTPDNSGTSTDNTGRIYNIINTTNGTVNVNGAFQENTTAFAVFGLGNAAGNKSITVQCSGTKWWIITRN